MTHLVAGDGGVLLCLLPWELMGSCTAGEGGRKLHVTCLLADDAKEVKLTQLLLLLSSSLTWWIQAAF